MEPEKSQSMIETTDALEAVSACQSMKNFLFVLIVLSMFICQLVFWMNWFGLVDKGTCSGCTPVPICPSCPAGEQCDETSQAGAAAAAHLPVYLAATVEADSATEAKAVGDDPEAVRSIEASVEEVIESAKVSPEKKEILFEKETDMIPAEISTTAAAPESQEPSVSEGEQTAETEDELSVLRISCRFASILITICNFIILMGAVVYCLTLLICLKISLAGRLGGLSHISRAFFLSLILLIVVVPWQRILPGVLVGSVWTPGELMCGDWAKIDGSVLWKILYFLRFCGLWIVAFWLLIWTQNRSAKWARATLRRLGVVK